MNDRDSVTLDVDTVGGYSVPVRAANDEANTRDDRKDVGGSTHHPTRRELHMNENDTEPTARGPRAGDLKAALEQERRLNRIGVYGYAVSALGLASVGVLYWFGSRGVIEEGTTPVVVYIGGITVAVAGLVCGFIFSLTGYLVRRRVKVLLASAGAK